MNVLARDKSVMSSANLSGKTALVSGAARRIGRHIARALADAGVNVLIQYRQSAQEAESLRDELVGRGVDAWPVRADFDRSEGPQDLFENAVKLARSIDFLINSASSFTPSTLQDIDFAQLTRDMQVNAWSPFVLSRQFARRFGRGKIVNLLDTRVVRYDPSHMGYILSKRLLLALTEMMAVEFAPHITVNAVAPGLILPPPGKDQQYLNALAATVPLKRHGELSDVSDAVLFFLKNDFVTGQTLFIDGGSHLTELTRGPNNNQ